VLDVHKTANLLRFGAGQRTQARQSIHEEITVGLPFIPFVSKSQEWPVSQSEFLSFYFSKGQRDDFSVDSFSCAWEHGGAGGKRRAWVKAGFARNMSVWRITEWQL